MIFFSSAAILSSKLLLDYCERPPCALASICTAQYPTILYSTCSKKEGCLFYLSAVLYANYLLSKSLKIRKRGSIRFVVCVIRTLDGIKKCVFTVDFLCSRPTTLGWFIVGIGSVFTDVPSPSVGDMNVLILFAELETDLS